MSHPNEVAPEDRWLFRIMMALVITGAIITATYTRNVRKTQGLHKEKASNFTLIGYQRVATGRFGGNITETIQVENVYGRAHYQIMEYSGVPKIGGIVQITFPEWYLDTDGLKGCKVVFR